MTHPWIDPQLITPVDSQTAIRNAYVAAFSSMGQSTLDPEGPMPVLLGFIFVSTRPHPSDTDTAMCTHTVFVRSPAHVKLRIRPHLRHDSTLDVHHATVRGSSHALFAYSDCQLHDDLRQTGHQQLALPPNAIGWALQEVCDELSVTCRHWRLKGGSAVWQLIQRETHAAEQILGYPRGAVANIVAQLESMPPEDAADLTAARVDEAIRSTHRRE